MVELTERPILLSKEDTIDFDATFPCLVKELTENLEMCDMDETHRWLAQVLNYNVPYGKKSRGLSTALAYRYMGKDLNETNVKLSYILGWTVEMLQASLLVADDLMDHSLTRRGKPCWYLLENVGSGAVNDAMMIEMAIYAVLKTHFALKDYYVDILDLMHDVSFKTLLGQSLDTRLGMNRQMETYNMDRYKVIVKYKTSYYSFYLPVRMAMAMAKMKGPQLIRQVQTVTLEMGQFFQVQDDFLDCFGDVSVTGKIGTDIQDCKCSWLIVTALERATLEQRGILLENYGHNVESKIKRVKEVYMEIKIPDVYEQYEEQTFHLISAHIQQMSPELPKKLFSEMLAKIYQRKS